IRADQAFWQKDYKQAEGAYSGAAKGRPDNARIYNQWAYAVAEQGRPAEALEIAKKAVAVAPNVGTYIDTVAEMNQRIKNYSEAADLYERALKYLAPQETCETHCKYG